MAEILPSLGTVTFTVTLFSDFISSSMPTLRQPPSTSTMTYGMMLSSASIMASLPLRFSTTRCTAREVSIREKSAMLTRRVMILPLPVMRASDGMLMSVAVTAVCAVAVQAETVMAVAASMVAIERIVFFMALFFCVVSYSVCIYVSPAAGYLPWRMIRICSTISSHASSRAASCARPASVSM